MSKIVVFSDLHIHSYGQFNDGGSRLKNCIRVLFDIAEFCVQNDIKTIMFVGDLYDTQKALLTEVVNEVIDAFMTFAEKYPDLKIISISGNHDHASKNLFHKPAVTAQTHIARIIPNNFVLIDNSYYEQDGVAIYGVPYYEYPEQFSQALDEIIKIREESTANFHYLMIHQTPKGLENKMIPFDCDPRDQRFDWFNHTFCGHIHGRQSLSEIFTIVGSPLHRDMGDVGKVKGFLVFNSVKPDKGTRFIPLKDYPMFEEVYEDEEAMSENNFVVVKPRMDLAESTATASVENFSTSLKNEDLMVNFWEEVDGKDEALLKTGLSFLKS